MQTDKQTYKYSSLQITYLRMVRVGWVPYLRHFSVLIYCLGTAIQVHLVKMLLVNTYMYCICLHLDGV